MFWRMMSADPQFEIGIQHLRRDHAPRTAGETIETLLSNAARWQGYQRGLDDLVDVLTAIESKPILDTEDRLQT